MSKTDCDDDADGNSSDDCSVDENGIFGKWCVYGRGGDEQIVNVAGDLAECNGSSKMEMRVGVMQ